MSYNLTGDQYGEYFGYAVLSVDINNDQLTDLIVSAPLFSTSDIPDVGAIYVFINLGNVYQNIKIFVMFDK